MLELVDFTAGGREDRWTADYFVIPAPVPCSVAVFTCRCGAHEVEYDVKKAEPTGWSTADDGSDRCPRCSAELAGRTT